MTAFPDCRATIDDIVAEGDRGVLRWTVSGTHQGTLRNIPASGKPVSVPGISVFRFAGGKAVEGQEAWDNANFMQQIGFPPQAAQAGA